MAEREFDWPEEMPGEFWDLRNTDFLAGRYSSLNLAEGRWRLFAHDWPCPILDRPADRPPGLQEAYTALREHVLREREEPDAQPLSEEGKRLQQSLANAMATWTPEQWDKAIAALKEDDQPQPPEREERPWKGCEYTLTASKLHDSLDWLADRQDLHGVAGIDLVGLVSDLRKRLERLEATND